MAESYRSPYAGTIADLMRQRAASQANTVRANADATGQARAASGQAWGGAIQNIGQAVSGTLADYARQKAEAPERQMRQRQSDLIAHQLTQLETSQAQAKIGELAQMVQASGYDPGTAEPIFRAIGTLSPEYAEPLMRSLMEPDKLKSVTDLLVTHAPGYKAPESFSLSEGQTRFGPDGKPIANVPKAAPVAPPPQPFTLGEGQTRYNPDGSVVAAGPAKAPPPPSNPTEASLAMLAASGDQQAAAALKLLRDQHPKTEPQGPQPTWQWVVRNGDEVYTNRVIPGDRPQTNRVKATEDERKTAGFYGQMSDAIALMDELENQLSETELYQIQTMPQEGLIGLANRGKLSEPAKRYLRAFEQFTEARLRPVSGAAISDSEFARDRRTYARQFKETPELNKDRRSARNRALDSLKKRAGVALDDGNAPASSGGNYLSNDPNAGEPIKSGTGKPKV